MSTITSPSSDFETTPCSPVGTCVDMAADLESALLDPEHKHGRYRANAYRFTLDAVHFTVQSLGEIRHVSGEELLEGIRRLALTRFGPLAKTVFEQWGIKIGRASCRERV